EGDVLLLKVGGEVATDANSKGIVAAIAYYDASGNVLPTPYPKTATSERFPAYIYVPTTEDAAAQPAFVELPVPAGASTIELHLIAWRATGTIVLKSAALLRLNE